MKSPTGTLDLSGLSLMLEQAIEAAVEKAVERAVKKAVKEAVAEAMANNNERAINALPESLSNQDTTLVPEGDSSTTVHVQHTQHTDLEKRLPTEIWTWIFEYLYPSQLSRVSMVCRTFRDIISKLSIWPEIYAKAHPDGQNHAVGGFKPVQGKNPNKDFMLHVRAESFQICELCFSVYSDTNVSKDRLAFFPLPVHVWRVRLASKKTNTFQPFATKIGPQDWVIRICLECRRRVFEQCPESIPKSAQGTISCYDIGRKYHLGGYIKLLDDHDRSRRSREPEEAILTKARVRFGGDVGIQAAGVGSSSGAIESMESRLEEISLRLTRAAVDG